MRPLKVLFLVPYPYDSAPGQRFRFEQWLRLLPEGAIEADIRPLLSSAAYKRLYEAGGTARKVSQTTAGLARRLVQLVTARSSDVIFVYREAFPFGPPWIEASLSRHVPVVFDFDDTIFLGATSDANAVVRRLKMPGKVDRIVSLATATTVSNDYLARYAERFSSTVHIIPTTIDTERYRPPKKRRSEGLVRVGWSGSPTTARYLTTIAGALRRVLRELPVELVVIGDPAFRLAGAERVTVSPWLSETEIEDVGAFDIGLMPLTDDDWSRGKGGFKALLYMALGVPAIVSPVGVNNEIVSHGINGLHASNEDDWVRAIAELVEDPSLRARFAEAGRRTVVERYSGQEWAPRWLELLRATAVTQGARNRAP